MLSKKYIKKHELELRSAIVTEAYKWIGSRYHVNGMLEYKACDCHTLPMMIFRKLGLIEEKTMPKFYRPDFSFHTFKETYLEGILEIGGKEVSCKKAGDLILYRYARLIDHSAIVIDESGLMIDSAINRGVTLQDYNQEINKSREVAVYSFWGNE